MNANGQNTNKAYGEHWKNVESAIKKGLPANALAEVKKIYAAAKADGQDAQLIKAVVYMLRLQEDTQENYEILTFQELEKDVAESKGATQAIFQSILARAYQNYYESVRWEIYERTSNSGHTTSDVNTWTSEDFHAKISALFLASIQNEKLLQQIALENYDLIIRKGNVRKLRPTLYDLLAYQALSYFSASETQLKKPAYAFEINTASAYDPAADFIHRKFETRDTASLEYKTLLLYQRLIAFHLNDREPDALIDADLMRLQYVRQKSVHPQREELYLMAVSHIAHQYEKTPAAAQAWYLVAAFHDANGNTYRALEDTTYRFSKIKAEEICERIIRDNPHTEGGVNAANLLTGIRGQSLTFTTENVVVPGKPFLALASYRNMDRLHMRILPATTELKRKMRYNMDARFWALIRSQKSLRAWEQILPATGDRQEHRVEIKINALPIGEYIILMSSDADFASKTSLLSARMVFSSNISFIKKENDFFVLNRDTGHPIPKARVELSEAKYDYSTGTNQRLRTKTFITDKNGWFRRTWPSPAQRVLNEVVSISVGDDRLDMDQNLMTQNLDQHWKEKPPVRIFLFSDRSIYRPGQTMYYKGIVAEGKSALINSRQEFTVSLLTANGEQADSAKLRTNDYGSFSGKFQLPQHTLTGSFRIVASTGDQINFQVEEYKRPRFEVTFDTLQTAYKVNDTISITGKSLAYAGNLVSGATVSYRVTRRPRLLYPWLSKRWWFPASANMEIAHGETVTDTDGRFLITFQAIPDLKIDKNLDPAFDYTIETDVTDSNGETRSAQMVVSAGYKSVLIRGDIPGQAVAEELKSLAIRTENMNGAFVPAAINVKISSLEPESRLIRARHWQRPDVFVMNKAEFVNDFPNDAYDNETASESWPVKHTVLEKSMTLTKGKSFELGQILDAGFYKIEIFTTDPSGEQIKDVRYIELTGLNLVAGSNPAYIRTSETGPAEPGDNVNFRIGSSARDVFLIKNSSKKPDHFDFQTISNSAFSSDFKISESDRGGFWISFAFVKHNRFYIHREMIRVSWTNKDLDITYQTYRDKTQPGSEEKWTVNISGYKKDKVAAEMLAGMYDASLDQFYSQPWKKPDFWPNNTVVAPWGTVQNFSSGQANNRYPFENGYKSFEKNYDALDGLFITSRRFRSRLRDIVGGVSLSAPASMSRDASLQESASVGYGTRRQTVESEELKQDREEPEDAAKDAVTGNNLTAKPPVAIRTNLNETAFFFPDLKTDNKGKLSFTFKMPEALTRWKFQALAHTRELAFGYSTREIVTQKDLMVQPNPPRFLREGDQLGFPVKVVNLSSGHLEGSVSVKILDAETREPLDELFKNADPKRPFSIPAGQSVSTIITLTIPAHFTRAIIWQAVATSGNLSDGEENILPVLSNRMLVTESVPFFTKNNEEKTFRFEKLLRAGESKTLTHQSLTVEYTANPVWYAVQALPYLMEYPYECAEQSWNRFYANALASRIVSSSPRIAKVFETWKNTDTTALMSNLEKNQELKSLLLQETPWVLQAESEFGQKRNIALLFDLVKMNSELDANFRKLAEMQLESGGFPWFKDGGEDRYITQYIVSGIGHLAKAGNFFLDKNRKIEPLLDKALSYLDKQITADYDGLIQYKTDLKRYTPGPIQLQYLYLRSFFPDKPMNANAQKACQYFKERAKATWVGQSKYSQGLIALIFNRSPDQATAKAILESLRQTAIRNEELGMYWKSNSQSWWWHEAPIERQALLIEAFQEISGDTETVNALKTWLLKNKQTNRWESTKATAEACYALLMQGADWLNDSGSATITFDNVELATDSSKEEAGTGYFKKIVAAKDIKPEMGHIRLRTKGNAPTEQPGWGAVYWQYFEDLDKITFAQTPLQLQKQLFIQKNTDRGPVLVPVSEAGAVKVGDKIMVRIELRVDRDMEYVHMKDMRASGLEPVNVLSGHKWHGGLGYYESTGDASTNFFFNSLNKGTYVFEYPLFVHQAGDFSNGITTVQCMYAPEFSAHSEGVRVKVSK